MVLKGSLWGGGKDGRGVGDPIPTGPRNLAGYLPDHSEHPQNQPEM